MSDRVTHMPSCEIVAEMAQLLVNDGASGGGIEDFRRMERRWPRLSKELARRERRSIWRSCGCDLCERLRNTATD